MHKYNFESLFPKKTHVFFNGTIVNVIGHAIRNMHGFGNCGAVNKIM